MNKIEKLKQMLIENPTDDFLEHALALEYIKLSDDGEAEQVFRSLLARNEKYIGSYYHLAKLYERQGQLNDAIETYQTGMQQAKLAGDSHAYSEMQSALDELIY